MDTQKKLILVVDDEKLLAEALKEKLSTEGFEIQIAYDGEQAVHLAKSSLPALILLDIYMPKMNGVEVVKTLKKEEATKNIPVIIISNLSNEDKLVQMLDLGGTDYIAKSDTSLEKITNLIRQKI